MFQEYIARKWSTLSDKYRSDLREFLYKGAQRENQIQFITVKYIKVFVNIGIRQWAADDTFFKQIMQVLFWECICYCYYSQLLMWIEHV